MCSHTPTQRRQQRENHEIGSALLSPIREPRRRLAMYALCPECRKLWQDYCTAIRKRAQARSTISPRSGKQQLDAIEADCDKTLKAMRKHEKVSHKEKAAGGFVE